MMSSVEVDLDVLKLECKYADLFVRRPLVMLSLFLVQWFDFVDLSLLLSELDAISYVES